MQFAPRKAADDVNVSTTHPLTEAASLVAGLGLIFALIVVLLITIVDISLRFVTPEDEAKLFASWDPEGFLEIDADDTRAAAVQELLESLTRHWPDSPYVFRASIQESDVPNALAFPGGRIVVTTALLNELGSENELAFVLGHELGHYRNRDHLRSLGRVAVIGLVFAVISGSEGSGSVTFGATIAEISLRGYSRKQESEADEFGIGVVNAEYGHINGSTAFFEKMLMEQKSTLIASYLSTHPATAARIDELLTYAGDQNFRSEGDLTALPWAIDGSE